MPEFTPTPSRPLSGKTVLVTRPREQSAEIIKLLEQLGATVELFPTIQIAPPSSWADCDNALSRIKMFDGIILTSQNASEFFFKRLEEKNLDLQKIFSEKKIYVIGKKTEEGVKKFGLHITPLPESVDSKHFAVVLSKEAISGKRFLFPKGNLAGTALATTLRQHGAQIEEIVVYETTAPLSTDTSRISRLIQENQINVLTFFSPSSFANFLAVIQASNLRNIVIAAIGNTTADAIRSAGFETDIVAEQPTTAGLVAAIVKFYSMSSSNQK